MIATNNMAEFFRRYASMSGVAIIFYNKMCTMTTYDLSKILLNNNLEIASN